MKRPAHLANWIPPAVYVLTALIILGPALGYGYIFTLDMVFTPHMPMPAVASNLAPYNALMSALSYVVPSWLLQKLLLTSILAGAGLGMHRLVSADYFWAKLAAGLFYMINPFTYDRLMAGQYLVLAGYALLPWLLRALLRLLESPGWKPGLALGGWLIAIGCVSLHTLGFALAICTLAIIIALGHRRYRHRPLRQLAVAGALAIGTLLMVSLYWIVPLTTHRTAQAALISSFDERHFLSFRTVSDPVLGVAGNVLALYGFWAEREDLYILPKAAASYWWIAGILLGVVALLGIGWSARKYRLATGLFACVLMVAWILAQGITDSPFAALNHWLFQHVPFYRGYREPGKFIALIALAESWFFGMGVAAAHDLLGRRHPAGRLAQYGPGVLLALPLLYVPTLAWGAAGQLRAVDYPRDWYALNQDLKTSSDTGKLLFLPWHLYLYFDFSGRLIANPAPHFFDRPTIAGDNPEIGLIKRQSPNPVSELIEAQILGASSDRTKVGERLAGLGVEYIVLAKTADYSNYDWLDTTPGLTLVRDSATLRIYRNLKWSRP